MLQRRSLYRRLPTAPTGVAAQAQAVANLPEPGGEAPAHALTQAPAGNKLQAPPAGKGPAHAWPRKR